MRAITSGTKSTRQNKMDTKPNSKQQIPATLTRRPRLILGITAFMTLCAILYAFFIATPIYEAQAMVQVGKINGNHVEPIKSTRGKLAFTHQLDSWGHNKRLPVVSSVVIPVGQADLLLVKTIGLSNEDAIKLLHTKVDTLIKRQSKDVEKAQKAYKATIKSSEFQLKSGKASIKEIRQNIIDYDKKVLKLTKEDVSLLGTYFLELWKLRANIEKNERWIGSAAHHLGRARLMLVDTKPPQLVGEIMTSDKPAKPRKALIVTVGFVSGILLSLLIVFFLDFLLEMREKRAEDK